MKRILESGDSVRIVTMGGAEFRGKLVAIYTEHLEVLEAGASVATAVYWEIIRELHINETH